MDNNQLQELREFLQENLKISVSANDYRQCRDQYLSITVDLKLCGEVISTDESTAFVGEL